MPFDKHILLSLVSPIWLQCSVRVWRSVCCQHPPCHRKHMQPQKETEQIFPKVSVKSQPLLGPFVLFFSAVIKLSMWKKKPICLLAVFSSGLTGVAFGSHCYTELISQWVVMLIFTSKLSRFDFFTVKIIWTEKENICNLSVPTLLNCPTEVAVLL